MAFPTARTNKVLNGVAWVMQVLVAGVLVWTGALPKLLGEDVSVALFEVVAGEAMAAPARIGAGVTELLAAVLLLGPGVRVYGAVLAGLTMVGAIGAHLFTPLGISGRIPAGEMNEEMNLAFLFPLALTLLVVSAVVVVLRRDELPAVASRASEGGRPAV